MTTQKRRTSIYLTEKVREAIAEKEQRSFAFVVEPLLKEALAARKQDR